MDRIARWRRSELEKKLRDARKVLREIARSNHPARSSQLATWALELIFDEPRLDDFPIDSIDSAMSPLRLEIPIAPAEPAPEEGEPNGEETPVPQTVPFEPVKKHPLRVVRGGLPEELVRKLIG